MAKEKQEEETEEGTEEKGSEDEKKEGSGKKKEPAKVSRRIIRMGGKDIDGDLPLSRALMLIRGVRFTFSNAVSKVSGLGDRKLGDLKEDERKLVEDIMENPGKHGIPAWICNRRSDPETGADGHIISAKLDLRHKMDINELKKRKCYRGVRHIQGLPVRGQRTRSSFRKSATVGVSRVKKAPAKKKE